MRPGQHIKREKSPADGPAPEITSNRLTPDEVIALINDFARQGEKWALQMLHKEAEAEVVLAPVMSDSDVTARMARLMRGAGIVLTKAAFVIAFEAHPAAKVSAPVPDFALDMDFDVRLLPKTLKQYYRRYPELKKDGFPKGYPFKDPIKQMKWIEQRSLEYERAKHKANAADIVAGIHDISGIPTDGDDGSQTSPEATTP